MSYVYPDHYKFNEPWFDPIIPFWEKFFTEYTKYKSINSVLEIGCYEGRASIYLLNNFLSPTVTYDVVDTFGGSLKEIGMHFAKDRLEENKNVILDNFIHNFSFHKGVDLNIYQGLSQDQLPKLVSENKKYDFIYIDASHRADDTLVDGYFANKLLPPGGLLIFDDYLWQDPTDKEAISSPRLGIEMFFGLYGKEYDVVGKGYQIFAIKKTKK